MKPISFMEMKGALMKNRTTHKIFVCLAAIDEQTMIKYIF